MRLDITSRQGNMHFPRGLISIGRQTKWAVIGFNHALTYAPNRAFVNHTKMNQVRNRTDFQFILGGKFSQRLTISHRTICV